VWKRSDFSFVLRIGKKSGSGDGQFHSPHAVAVSGNEVFVADSKNERIQVFDLRNGKFLRKWGSYGSRDGELDFPMGLAILGDELFVSESNGHRISVFNKNTGKFLRKWGRNGMEEGEFNHPGFMTIGLANELYIVDSMNHRVQVCEPATGKCIHIIGEEDEELDSPFAVACVGDEVFVTNTRKNRISIFSRSDGEYLGSWGRPAPLGITASVAKELIVTEEDNHKIQVFT
jgi:DNA-binding beta-propeller fold protein YncE